MSWGAEASHSPVGRNETRPRNLTDWVRHHDRREDGGSVDSRGRYVPAMSESSREFSPTKP